MNRLLHLLFGLAAVFAGFWFLYAGYGRGVSLAGRTETSFAQLRTGLDGKTRVPTHHWQYAAGAACILGGAWWLGRSESGGKRRRSRRR